MATPAGAPLGSYSISRSPVLPTPSAAPLKPAPGHSASTVEVEEEILLQEPLRLFDSSMDAAGSDQDSTSTIASPGDPGATRGEGRALAPSHTTVANSIPGHENISELSSEISSSSTATPEERTPDSNIPASGDSSSDTDISWGSVSGSLDISVPSSSSAVHQCQVLEDLTEPQEVLLEEVLRLFACSPEGTGVSHMPTEPGDTCRAISPSESDSLEVPEELLTHYYTLEETMEAVRFLEQLYDDPESQELWEDVGTEPPPESREALGDVGTEASPKSEEPWGDVGMEPSRECQRPWWYESPEPWPMTPEPQGNTGTAPSPQAPEPRGDTGTEPSAESPGPWGDVGTEPSAESPEPWGDVGTEVPATQPALGERRGTKRGSSPPSPPPSKRRALAGGPGANPTTRKRRR